MEFNSTGRFLFVKRRIIYVIPILLIVLGTWLFLSQRENENASEHKVKEATLVTTTENVAAPVNVTVVNEQDSVQYLTPAYEVSVKKDILYASKKNESDAEEPLKLDLYQPSGDDNKQRPVFMFIHGGGYSGGGKYDAEVFSTGLAKRGYAVLSVDYRLKKDPSSNFSRTLTDACEDIDDVITWVNEHAEDYGLDNKRIAIGGDSAGGHLAMNFVNIYVAEDSSTVKSVFAIVDIYGGDLTRGVDSKLPPVLIIHGTVDKLVPYQLSIVLAEQLKEKGIYHNFLTMKDVGHDYKNAKYIDEIMETTSHFLWNIMRTQEVAKLPENSGISVASGDTFDFKLPEYYNGSSQQLNVAMPAGWLLISQEGNILRVKVPAGLERGDHSLFISQGTDQATGFAINTNVIDPQSVQYETFYEESTKAIRTHMDVINRSTNNFTGLVEAEYNTEQSNQGTYSASVKNLEPGKSIRLDIPELARGQRTFKALNNEGILLQSTADTFNALLLPKLREPIQIDGKLSKWSDQTRFEVKDVQISDWQGDQDISATGFLSWDTDNLYLALEVIDDKHVQSLSGDAIWSGDSIQIGIGIANSDGTVPSEYHELGVARGDTGALLKWRWQAPSGFNLGDAVDLQFAIDRVDSKTNYEIAIPWHELSHDIAQVKQGMKLKFSLLINDNDGEGRRGWLEYNSGIGTFKDVNAFGDLYLTD
jgi:acetyl esterase/lipase